MRDEVGDSGEAKNSLDGICNLRFHFAETFRGESGQIVLKYLEQFADVDKAPFIADAALASYWQGRRSVLCAIRQHFGKE